MSNFSFIRTEWPALHEPAHKAESFVYPDPRASCFYARRALELVVDWMYTHDRSLKVPYQDHLSALIHEPTFRGAGIMDSTFNRRFNRILARSGGASIGT